MFTLEHFGLMSSCWPCCGPRVVVVQVPASPGRSPCHSVHAASSSSSAAAMPVVRFNNPDQAEAHCRSSLRGAFLYKTRLLRTVRGGGRRGGVTESSHWWEQERDGAAQPMEGGVEARTRSVSKPPDLSPVAEPAVNGAPGWHHAASPEGAQESPRSSHGEDGVSDGNGVSSNGVESNNLSTQPPPPLVRVSGPTEPHLL